MSLSSIYSPFFIVRFLLLTRHRSVSSHIIQLQILPFYLCILRLIHSIQAHIEKSGGPVAWDIIPVYTIVHGTISLRLRIQAGEDQHGKGNRIQQHKEMVQRAFKNVRSTYPQERYPRLTAAIHRLNACRHSMLAPRISRTSASS